MNMVMDLNLIMWFAIGAVVLAVALVAVAVVLRIVSKSRGPVILLAKKTH